jgi:hypothetical protein
MRHVVSSPILWLGLLATGFVLLAPFYWPAYIAIRDSDTAWLVRTGDWILHHGRLPGHNVFGAPYPQLASMPWVTYQWLLECLFSLIHQIGGLAGIIGLTAVVYGWTVSCMATRLCQKGFHAWGAVFPATAILLIPMAAFANARPHCYSLLLTIVLLALLENRGHKKLWLILPAMFCLWSNLHMGFIAGLLVLMVYTLTQQNNRLGWFTVGLSLAGSLVNPYGPLLFAYLFKLSASPAMMRSIVELKSFDFQASPPMLAIVVGSLFCVAWRYWHPALTRFDRVFLWLTLTMTLYSTKNTYLFIVAAAPFMTAVYHDLFQRIRLNAQLADKTQSGALPCVKPSLLALCLVVPVIGGVYAASMPPGFIGFKHQEPVQQAMAYFKAHPVNQPVFMLPDWGSQFIYYGKTPPLAVCPLIDTRFDMVGDRYFARMEALINLSYEWQKVIQYHHIQWAVMPPGVLSQALQQQARFTPVFQTNTLVILKQDSD